MQRKPVPEPIERPQSVVSTTTNTTINDHDDSLSSVTTPRGGTPVSFDHVNHDLPPPSYDESQAAYVEARHPSETGSRNDVIVYRTEVDQHPYPPPLHPEQNVYGVNDAFTTIDGSQKDLEDQARPSVLLYQALAFTNTPAPALNENYVSHLTRPVAIPSLASSDGAPSCSSIRFARLYSRALQSTSITAAQFASFLDGLNAICTASCFSASNLHDSSSFRFSPDSDVPREEWVRAYIQLSNSNFFAPRGLRMHITTLKELLELAKVPEHHGFRTSMRDIALNAAISGIGTTGDESMRAASEAAAGLDPYIEPLSNMIPAMHRDSEAMDHVAVGLANFELAEQERKESELAAGHRPDELGRSVSDSVTEQPKRRFWSPFGMGPISLGPIVPPALPASERPRAPGRSQTWQEWGEDFSRRMEKWGEQYGKEWEKWGEEYGKAWEEWGSHFGRKISGSSSSSKIKGKHKECGASKESFFSGASKSSGSLKKGKDDKDEDQDWDDSASDASTSTSSSSSSDDTYIEDPEAIFASKVAEIDAMAERARLTNKKDDKSIEKERVNAIHRAELEKIRRESKIQHKLRNRQLKRSIRQYKRLVKTWKRNFKKDMKQLKKSGAPASEMRELTRRRMEEFHERRKQWEEAKKEVAQIRYGSKADWIEGRAQRKAEKHIRRQERKERRRRGGSRDGRRSRDGRGRHGRHGGCRDWNHQSDMIGWNQGAGAGMGWHPGHGSGPHQGPPIAFGENGPFGGLHHGPFGRSRRFPFGRGRGSYGPRGFGRGWGDWDAHRGGLEDDSPTLKDEDMLWVVIRNLD